MTNTINQVEKNTQASFGYVKKDLLMLNDTVSDIQTKINHLSMNHAALMEQIGLIELALEKLSGKRVSKKRVGKRKKRGK